MSAFQAANDSSPTSASDSITCSRSPEDASDSPSCKVAKHSLPVLRMNTTRPVTETTSAVSSPTSPARPHCSADRRETVGLGGTLTGNGLAPSSASSRSRLS